MQPPLTRLAHPKAFAAFLETLGAPTERLFRSAGLPLYCEDPTAFVPVASAWRLFHIAARSEDPTLGWQVGRFCGDRHLSGGLLKKLESAPTLYRALHKLVALVRAEASHLELGIAEGRDAIYFHTEYSQLKDLPGYAESQAYQLEVYVDLVRHYLGRRWHPPEIGIELPSVPRIAHEHFPGARIRAGSRVGYIAIPRSVLHVGPPDDGAPEAVEDPLPSTKQTAALMDTSVRTLSRRLREHGVSYQSIIDRVRFAEACRLLGDDSLRIVDISQAVGFEVPAHFARMFRRVGGTGPREFRRTVAAGGRRR
jgi:AraC-like DNA-binding protein